MTVRYVIGDSCEVLDGQPRRSIDQIVQSPAYWGQRRYTDDEREHGAGSLDAYIADMVRMGRAIEAASTREVVWWLNLADTAIGSGGAGGDYNPGGSKAGRPKYRQGAAGGLPKQSFGLIPFAVARALMDDGWKVRATVVWDKQRPRRESWEHVRRPLLTWEPVIMLTRTMRYRWTGGQVGDVWRIPADRARTGHQAPFPVALARRCLECTARPGMLVADPTAGSGTVGVAAELAGCDALLIDIDPASAAIAATRIPDLQIDRQETAA